MMVVLSSSFSIEALCAFLWSNCENSIFNCKSAKHCRPRGTLSFRKISLSLLGYSATEISKMVPLTPFWLCDRNSTMVLSSLFSVEAVCAFLRSNSEISIINCKIAQYCRSRGTLAFMKFDFRFWDTVRQISKMVPSTSFWLWFRVRLKFRRWYCRSCSRLKR